MEMISLRLGCWLRLECTPLLNTNVVNEVEVEKRVQLLVLVVLAVVSSSRAEEVHLKEEGEAPRSHKDVVEGARSQADCLDMAGHNMRHPTSVASLKEFGCPNSQPQRKE